MRTAFVNSLIELAEKDDSIWLINGDLGYNVLDGFRDRFPDRFLNAGVAEQNMIGMATGLALSGKTVFVYSIANVPTFRCLEQIRNDVCYHNANVKIVSVGAGYTYGSHGYTHHGVEDMAVMRVLPNMTVVAPGDPIESRLATQMIANRPGPAYLRIGKAGEPILHDRDISLEFGGMVPCGTEAEISLICIGGILKMALEVREKLKSLGIKLAVYSNPFLEPIDEKAVLEIAGHSKCLLTLEEHGIGGLGTVVSEIIAKNAISTRFSPIYLDKEIPILAGNQAEMLADKGLSVEAITNQIIHLQKNL